ncbi:MAG: histidine phosphatase family protein, partial [Luminiphilus sp.]
MNRVWLVRHGEAAASWGEHHDPGLSELGKAQAESAAELLHDVLPPATKLVSSPKQRALDTAQPLASRLNCDVVVDVTFREIDAPV